MRWLEGSPIDLENGIGGVEVSARATARELRLRGVDVVFSRNPEAWSDPSFDVIRTHGSALPSRKARASRNRNAVWLHTFHGSTLGRMRACGEWAWVGGYLAWMRELGAARAADALSFVRPGLEFEKISNARGIPARVTGNGWDAGGNGPVPAKLPEAGEKRPRFVFIGRGEDRVKGADRALSLMANVPGVDWVVVPGTGFPDHFGIAPKLDAATEYRKIEKTGVLSSEQVSKLLSEEIDGLLLSSRYEGNALVILEALSLGVRVVTSPVGASSWLRSLGTRGLLVSEENTQSSLENELRKALSSLSPETRRADAEENRSRLPSWGAVAEDLLNLVREAKEGRKP